MNMSNINIMNQNFAPGTSDKEFFVQSQNSQYLNPNASQNFQDKKMQIMLSSSNIQLKPMMKQGIYQDQSMNPHYQTQKQLNGFQLDNKQSTSQILSNE